MADKAEGSGETGETSPAKAPLFGFGVAPAAGGAGAAFGGGFSGFTGVSGFGTAGGFGAFGAAASDKKKDEGEDGEEGDAGGDPEAECQAQFKPIVELPEVATSTGEEDEDVLLDVKAKLYRYDDNQWKERGVGQVKLLQHKVGKRVRLLMRRERTLKICANHLVMPSYQLKEHAGNDKAWVWSAYDAADGPGKTDMFAMRFGSVDKAQAFKTAFEAAQATNTPLLAKSEGGSGESPAIKGAPRDAGAASHSTVTKGKEGKGGEDVEDGEEVTSAAADELAAQLGKAQVK